LEGSGGRSAPDLRDVDFRRHGIHDMRDLSPISFGVILLGMSISIARR
jgi:hypothetical protein